MKLLNSYRTLVLVIFAGMMFSQFQATAADGAPKDAQSVLNQMRLKKYTKDLELTGEQQKKVGTLLDAESKEVSKLQDDANLSITERSVKVKKLREDTYAKMKPLLTPAQLEKFEAAFIKGGPKKK